MSTVIEERVLSVRHWTETLFSFMTTRNQSFRFRSGQFTMVGLEVGGRRLLRAYSMASAFYEDMLEFFSIKIPDGALTSRLQHLQEGDFVSISQKATGTLVLDHLLPGEVLYLLATGTGLAPFASIIRDPETYERFRKIVLVHGCRRVAELGYGEQIVRELKRNELVGDLAAEKLAYFPTVTREPFQNRGRINELIGSQRLFEQLGLAPLNVETDRVMLCGSPSMLRDLGDMLDQKTFCEGSNAQAGHYVLERAFVER